MSIIQSIILGIVEGITEFLPISSTAHLDFTRIFLQIPETEFIKSFEICIQLGAILAVLILFFNKIKTSRVYVKNVLIAFIPTGIIGFLLYKVIKSFLIGNTILAATMLVLGGIIIIWFERKFKDRKKVKSDDIKDFSIKDLLILGLAQSLAVIPGVSRSGAVIIAGRSLKLSAESITEFSFLLAIPTMTLATIYDLYKNGLYFTSENWFSLIVGFLISFFVALYVVHWLIDYIKNHSFEIFGWYRIIFGLIILTLVVLKII